MADDEYKTQRRRRRSRSRSNEDEKEDDQGWLRLSIGASRHDTDRNQDPISPKRRRPVDLQLMLPSGTNTFHDLTMISRFSSPATNHASCSGFRSSEKQEMINLPAGGIDFRIIQPPCRPNSGLWFMLKASQQYQEKEPFLPQISKCYLRIKDGVMTIRLVKRYLISKLKLENESEMELTCKGQKLQPSFTLQHVRDNIWNSNNRSDLTLLPSSSATPHIMVLHYSRIASN